MADGEPNTDLARRLEQSISLAAAPASSEVESVRFGAFRAWFTTYTNDPQANYAMPVTPVESALLGKAVEVLHAEFAARARRLRVEFVEELWPGLAGALEHSGLHLEAREPLMACMKGEFLPAAAPGVIVRALTADAPDAGLVTFIRIRDQRPTDESRPVSVRAVAALRGRLRTDAETCVVAFVGDLPAGAGRCIPQQDGLGEITSIVTLPQFRRRGVAATLVSHLLRQLFDGGRAIGWLNAANDQARSVYSSLGFRSIGSLLNYEE
jgi:ribosomal protein S18 acetylase RimI-like enzyme